MIFLAAATAKSGITLINLAQIVGVIVGILGSVAFIIAFLRSNLAQSTINLQSDQITAQTQRIASLEDDVRRSEERRVKEGEEYQQKVIRLETRIETLEQTVKVMEGMKTGTEAVERLAQQITNLFITQNEKLDILIGKTN